ncbi:hypothetical protein VU04_11195, partial [Desulfobulbus sp. TB]|nr:hypothetical protein [Desulfobulbus sp. TB]
YSNLFILKSKQEKSILRVLLIYCSGTSSLLLRDERRQSQATSGEYTENRFDSQLKNAYPVLFFLTEQLS